MPKSRQHRADRVPPARPPAAGRAARAPDVAPWDAGSDSWDHVASWYDALAAERGTEFHQEVVIPGVLRLLALQPGERALDLACGQGAVANALARAGAQVTGVDLSPRLIEMARRHSPPSVRYLVGDARHLDALAAGGFDAIVFVLAATNVDPLAPVFTECARLLRPGGRLVMVIAHPAFRIPRQSAWRWDEERKLLYRAVDRYLTGLKIPIDMRPFKEPGRSVTWTYHRPIQAYVNGLAEAGLWTNALEEWPSHRASQPSPRARAENRARAEFPLFLALRAARVAGRGIP